ncbi:MAG: hypothetical protein JNG86_05585, partial [Verrucomicrobiaceae bacterium]|nr:hypothetical protein [Verrucomicrobiaceae bacterium]
DPVSPALQPPAALTKQAWKDAVLTSTGGTVLHPDGSISVWDEKRPNAVQRLDLHAAAIASSGDDVFMLDAKGGVVRLRDSKIVAEGLRAIFSFSQAGTLPALTSDENLVWLEIDSGTRKPLPKPPGAILRLAMLEGETLGCLLQSGDLLILEGSAFVKSSDASKHRAADLHAGDGFTLMVDENGRCMLSGIKIPNSPQRFRLPENAKNIRVGPLGRLVAW